MLRSLTRRAALAAALLLSLGVTSLACAGSEGSGESAEASDDDEQGLTGSHLCIASSFDCHLNDHGRSRIVDDHGNSHWAIRPGAAIRDGNGNVLGVETGTELKFNYGQLRRFAGEDHAFAMTTSNGSAGWYPVSHIHHSAGFRRHVGHETARNPHDGKLGCYAVRNDHDPQIELLKTIFDSKADHERAGDYLPLVRANGRRSANLCFNVPIPTIGGVCIDHYLAGTKFQRVNVPTRTNHPSIDIPLWDRDGSGRYRKRAGTLTFVYGYVHTAEGTQRFGWMARDALESSTGCR